MGVCPQIIVENLFVHAISKLVQNLSKFNTVFILMLAIQFTKTLRVHLYSSINFFFGLFIS